MVGLKKEEKLCLTVLRVCKPDKNKKATSHTSRAQALCQSRGVVIQIQTSE